MATLAASAYPKHLYEQDEENPMIGLRGCGRYKEQFFVEGLAIVKGLETVIKAARAKGKYVEICKDHPDLASWPMDQGIDSRPLFPTGQFLRK